MKGNEFFDFTGHFTDNAQDASASLIDYKQEWKD